MWGYWCTIIGLQVLLLFIEDILGYAIYAVMHGAVAGTVKPCQAVLIQMVGICEQPSLEEILLHILDNVLHLTLAFWV